MKTETHRQSRMTHLDGTEIAVIGMAGRFPGARNVDELWRKLRDGVESITFFTDEQLRASGVDPALLLDPDYVKAAAVMDDVDLFDASFFGFTAREAQLMDPQHRVLLECAWEAMEDAGYDSETLEGSVGVFAGATINTYLLVNLISNPELINALDLVQINVTNGADFLTTRISYKLDLKGPSHLVQSACSTSLVAVHIACQSLLNEECDMALAGGVSINQKLRRGYRYVEGGIASPDGRCCAFDAAAHGTLFGSGVGVVVLKRLKEALADGDCIRAVIIGSAINNDGALKVGYTAPSVDGQALVVTEALANAGVTAETISYVEAHGTGTPLGDPVEVQALTRAFRATTQKKGFCAIGSIKTNIGHLDAAAGVTSLIKTVLALKHQFLPPSLHFERPNPNIDFAGSPFYVNSTLSEWPANGTPRRAGVSSFGVGGTNAHVILQEAPPPEPSSHQRPYQLVVWSAKTSSALESATTNLLEYLKQNPNTNLADVAYTLQVGRRAFCHRRMVVCQSVADAVCVLETLKPGDLPTPYESSLADKAPPMKTVHPDQTRATLSQEDFADHQVVFMFPGQGAEHVNMGLELYQTEPAFRELIDRCSERLTSHLGLDLRTVLYPDKEYAAHAREQLCQTSIAQPALFVVEYALARMWMLWGVQPQAMIGHGLGEYVAACLAGVFSLEDALALVAARGRMMQGLAGGEMLSVPLTEGEVQPLLSGNISLSAINGPSQSVLSGPSEQLAELVERLADEGVACRRLPTNYAFHSAAMNSMIGPFSEQLRQTQLRSPQIPYISSLTGTWITEEAIQDRGYWAGHLLGTVRFADGLNELLKQPKRRFLEVGPGHMLSRLVRRRTDVTSERVVLASLPADEGSLTDSGFMLTTLGQLWLAAVSVDWPGFHAQERRRRLPLLTYPFERQRYWIEAREPHREIAIQKKDNRATGEEAVSAVHLDSAPLASHLHRRPQQQTPFVAPSSDLERDVARVWREVLGLESVGVDDNFFDLGGDSLIAIQAMAQLKRELGMDIPVVSLYEGVSIRLLIGLVHDSQNGRSVAHRSAGASEIRGERISRRKQFQQERLKKHGARVYASKA
jgi:phthiocerol/phenolphthiocerol synthesis type-I polyketide synthase E